MRLGPLRRKGCRPAAADRRRPPDPAPRSPAICRAPRRRARPGCPARRRRPAGWCRAAERRAAGGPAGRGWSATCRPPRSRPGRASRPARGRNRLRRGSARSRRPGRPSRARGRAPRAAARSPAGFRRRLSAGTSWRAWRAGWRTPAKGRRRSAGRTSGRYVIRFGPLVICPRPSRRGRAPAAARNGYFRHRAPRPRILRLPALRSFRDPAADSAGRRDPSGAADDLPRRRVVDPLLGFPILLSRSLTRLNDLLSEFVALGGGRPGRLPRPHLVRQQGLRRQLGQLQGPAHPDPRKRHRFEPRPRLRLAFLAAPLAAPRPQPARGAQAHPPQGPGDRPRPRRQHQIQGLHQVDGPRLGAHLRPRRTAWPTRWANRRKQLFPEVLALMRDNVLILTEDYISPDLSELGSYFQGCLQDGFPRPAAAPARGRGMAGPAAAAATTRCCARRPPSCSARRRRRRCSPCGRVSSPS